MVVQRGRQKAREALTSSHLVVPDVPYMPLSHSIFPIFPSPAPTHIPYTQHLVNTPSPYTHTLVHTAHSPCTSLCLSHTPNPDHIFTQYTPIYAQLAFLPTPSPVHAPNLPLTHKQELGHLTLPPIFALEICFLMISLHCTCCYVMSLYSRGCS